MKQYRYRLLIADDEYQIRRGLSKIVDWGSIDAEVVGVAISGADALARIQELNPDLVISDICMEPMSGLQLVREVRKFNPKIKFVFVSGHDDFAYAREAMELQVCRYILKPLVPEEILQTVKEVLLEIEKDRQKQTLAAHEKRFDQLAAEKSETGSSDNFLIKCACETIQELYRDPDFSQSVLAEKLQVNSSYISRLFSKEMGISYNKYLLRIRMEESKRLLNETPLRVSTIAGCVGFHDARYFSTQFKQYTGKTPMQFRMKGEG